MAVYLRPFFGGAVSIRRKNLPFRIRCGVKKLGLPLLTGAARNLASTGPKCLVGAVLLFSISQPTHATKVSDNEKRTRMMSRSWRPRLTTGERYARERRNGGFAHGSQ